MNDDQFDSARTFVAYRCGLRLRRRRLGAGQEPLPTDQAMLLGQFGDWGAYKATPGGKKVCFALSKPTSAVTEPGRPHARPLLRLRLDAAGREGEERGLGDRRLSAEARPRRHRRHRLGELRAVHPERRRLGEERRRRGEDGRRRRSGCTARSWPSRWWRWRRWPGFCG